MAVVGLEACGRILRHVRGGDADAVAHEARSAWFSELAPSAADRDRRRHAKIGTVSSRFTASPSTRCSTRHRQDREAYDASIERADGAHPGERWNLATDGRAFDVRTVAARPRGSAGWSDAGVVFW